MNEPLIEVLVTLEFEETQMALLEAVSPRLRLTFRPVRRIEEITAEEWSRTEVLYTDRLLPNVTQAPRLRWIQFHYAGIDFMADSPILRKPDLVATTLSGAAAPQIGEFALMMMLALGHRMPDLFANQQKADWPRDRWERFVPRELRGATLGLVGYGSISREIARLVQPMGMRILAAKRDVMHPHDGGYVPSGFGDPEGNLFTRLYPIQALKSMLKECDFIVVAVPLSASTRDLIGADELAAVKPTAFIIDFSRGGIINHPALIEALQNKRIGGAALDVFPEEPLPATSPLWRMPNVLLTPHIGGISPHYMDRAAAMFAENLQRYLEGEALYNRFEVDRGY
jgi:phosphoglycerate dehydrogenase-like enzyme